MTRRFAFPLALAVAGALFACKDDALSPDAPGSIVINIVAAEQSATAGDAARAPGARLEAQALDQVVAAVSGPVTKTQDLTFNAANNEWEGTIGDLTPGTYAVAVQGLSAGEVEYYGQTGNVSVSSGATATATISNWGDFRPTFSNLPLQTTRFTVRVEWNPVSTASGYILEWDTDQFGSFPNRLSGITGTTADVDFPQTTGTYWVRMRSVNQVVSGGSKPSDPQPVDIVTDITPSGDTPVSAPNLGFGTGANQTLSDLNIYPGGDQDWFAIDACNGDQLFVDVRAERLDPPSSLNPTLGIFKSSDGGQVGFSDDAVGLDPQLDVILPNNETYWIGVAGFDASEIGEYEIDITLTAGPNNQGTACGTPDLTPTSITGPSTGAIGEIIRVDVTVDNLGDGPARPGWTGDIRLSTNNIISTGDIQLTTYSEDTQIDPGVPFTRTLAVVLPETLTPGTYYLGVIVDANFDLSELDEGNNNLASLSTIDVTAATFGTGGLATLFLHTCRVDDSGNAQCWGDNLDGELGDGTLDNVRTSPVTVIGGLTFSQIVTGQFHTCGLTTAGEAYCWGWNGDGQLGDPNTTGTAVTNPSPVVGGLTFVKIASGWNHVCGIGRDGAAWCWGDGSDGALGDGTFTSSPQPVQVTGGPTFWKDIAAGDSYTCGLAADGPDGTVYCWGLNNVGQLGNGTFNDAGTPVMATGAGLASISISNWHTCGVTTAGQAYCWGLGGSGELGDGNFADSPTPVLVSGGYSWKAIVTGGTHTCGVQSDLSVWCWGSSGFGQLGDGSLGVSLGVPTTSVPGTFVTELAAGWQHTCARRTDGQYVCWGNNNFGQLGNGALLTYMPQASGATGMARAGAGQEHSCATTTGDQAYCWGRNHLGQVGDGGASGQWATSPVFTGLSSANRQPSGGWHHTCVIVSGNDSYCWGWNSDGQIGDGTVTDRFSPTLTTDFGSVLDQVASGTQHTCALKDTGEAYCWGDNSQGQLGDGTTNDASTPVAVAGAIFFQVPFSNTLGMTITAGQRHSCGIDTSGNAWCWGDNFYGQLGDGTTTDALTPVMVQAGGKTFASITAGDFHTCAVATDGTSWCWGLNNQGELGDGSGSNSSVPVQIAGGISFSMLSGGNDITCGIDLSGQAYCWGYNFDGQLGDGTFWDAFDPQPVQQGSLVFTHIAAGGRHVCAVANTSDVWCWGANRFGQLGNASQSVAVSPVIVLPAPAAQAGRSGFFAGARSAGRPFDRARFGIDPDRFEGEQVLTAERRMRR